MLRTCHLLTVVCLFTLGCGPATPPTTTTASEALGPSEAYIPVGSSGTAQIDSARYPAGATIEVGRSVAPNPAESPQCMAVALLGSTEPLPDSTGCDRQPGGQHPFALVVSSAIPLLEGVHDYDARFYCGLSQVACGFGDWARIRW